MAETFLPVVGYEGRYSVGDLGTVWSHRLGRPLSPADDSYGYRQVALYINRRRAMRRVHHLVLEAFVGPRPPRHVGMHLDHNPANNTLSNLAWGTQSENIRAAVAAGRHRAHNAEKTECIHGHSLADALITNRGWRLCRECNRINCAAQYARQKENR